MPLFSHGAVQEIATDNDSVFAFLVVGHMDDDASEAMAAYMNDVFDRQQKVNMLLDLSQFSGSDWDSLLDDAVFRSRVRALKHVDRYAVVGAPENAAKMIAIMDKILPVQARAFSANDISDAWEFVGARPLSKGQQAA